MRVVFDTNVVLDQLLERVPFADVAQALLGRVERQEISGLLCATTLTTVFYLTNQHAGRQETLRVLDGLMKIFEVAPVTRAVLDDALHSSFHDFEDAVLNEAARHAGADAIVTRNARDFADSTLTIYTPDELEAALGKGTGRP